MENENETAVYVFDEFDRLSIDRYELLSPASGWSLNSHIMFLKMESISNQNVMFVNRIPVEENFTPFYLPDDYLDHVPPDDYDILIVDYNRNIDAIETLKKPFRKRRKMGLWESIDEILMEDIACYVVSEKGIDKIRRLDVEKEALSEKDNFKIWKYNGKERLPTTGEWKSGAYLDNGSPILVCHLLEKVKGKGAGVYARPIFTWKGFSVSFIHLAMMMFAFLSGIIGIPGEIVMRVICVCHFVEPIEGLALKVVILLVVTRLLYAYGKDPLFFLW